MERLEHAIINGALDEIFQLLRDCGKEIGFGTALWRALESADDTIVAIVLGATVSELNFNIHEWDVMWSTVALSKCSIPVIQMLIAAGLDPVWKNTTAMDIAASYNHFPMLKYIWQLTNAQGISVDSTNWTGQTPLCFAADVTSPDADIIQFLLEKGANPSAISKDGRTPLHFLAGCSHRIPTLCGSADDYGLAIELFVQYGADINYICRLDCKDFSFRSCQVTPLMRAAYEGNVAAVEQLLAAGADVEFVDPSREINAFFLSLCGEGRNTIIPQVLVKAGAKIILEDNGGYTPLHFAADGGYMKFAHPKQWGKAAESEYFNAKCPAGLTALHHLCGADLLLWPIRLGSFGPLPNRSHQGVIAALDSFLQVPALDINVLDEQSESCLHYLVRNLWEVICFDGHDASSYDDLPTYRWTKGARDKSKGLRAAAVMETLLKHGADANVKNSKGQTPLKVLRLMFGESYNRIVAVGPMVSMLIEAGDFKEIDDLPVNISGIGRGLLAVWAGCSEKLPLLVKKLPEEDRARVRAALLSLHRYLHLPELKLNVISKMFKDDFQLEIKLSDQNVASFDRPW